MRNNISFPYDNTSMEGVDSKFNTWDLNITPAAKDFLSVSDPSMTVTDASVETTAGALGPRQANGSLPNVIFLKLVAGSQLIDKGTDVQLPFTGIAPDLGAYEFGLATSVREYQPHEPGTMPFFFSGENTDVRNARLFDVSGRSHENRGGTYTFQPFIYTAVQPDGNSRAHSIIRTR
jgi:hypothetical protein